MAASLPEFSNIYLLSAKQNGVLPRITTGQRFLAWPACAQPAICAAVYALFTPSTRLWRRDRSVLDAAHQASTLQSRVWLHLPRDQQEIIDGSDRHATLDDTGRLSAFADTGGQPAHQSQEAACILNAGSSDAHVVITVFFAVRTPAGLYRITVGAERTLHLRFNDLEDPEPIPLETPYASVIEADMPIVVQHTRLDARQANLGLLSTLAFPG